MANRRRLDYDALTKTTQWYHFDDATGDIGLEVSQDVGAIIDANKRLYNQVDGNARWGSPLLQSSGQGVRYARVPLLIFNQLSKVTNNWKDEKALRRWMNDRDNLVFRTRPGRI